MCVGEGDVGIRMGINHYYYYRVMVVQVKGVCVGTRQ